MSIVEARHSILSLNENIRSINFPDAGVRVPKQNSSIFFLQKRFIVSIRYVLSIQRLNPVPTKVVKITFEDPQMFKTFPTGKAICTF